jgi:histidine kinase
MMLHYCFQNYAQATQAAATVIQLLSDGAMGLLVVPIAYFYDSLAHLAIFADASPAEQAQILDKVASNQQKMQHWADHAPMNYQHKFELVEAERHRVLGNPLTAMEAYDRAIDLANQHDYLQEAALANELAGKFYLSRGQIKLAPVYLRDAHYAYQQWGAVAKVKDLEQRYPQFLGDLPVAALRDRSGHSQSSALSKVRSTSPDTSSSTESAVLDLATIMKAAQTLSSEIVLDQLLTNLMKILLENAGAERGYLILETQGKLLIEAEGVIQTSDVACPLQEQVTVLQSIPLEEGSTAPCHLSTKIIYYVARTQESVVLNQATQANRFSQDPYIIQYQPKSILCTPLMHQGKLSGILYVENNLTIDAFTAERLEVLQLLSVQAAIALENARLYHQLEQRVQERTVELFRANQQLQENEQQILQALEKERELNLLKSKFVSMVSHEFRNPMTTIGGCAKTLQNPNRHLNETQKETYLKLIQDSIADMLRLLDKVLVLGRTEAGGLQYNPKPLNLKQFCQGLTETLQVNLSERQSVTLTYQGEDHPVTMDNTLMQHILTNLLSNAIKYSPQGGQICFDVTCEGGMATFQIQDQGIGIPLNDQERLFETFHRSSNVGEIPGTGLGLAIVNRCVDLHQGQIHLASEVNIGTTVTVMLPTASD